MACKDWGGHGGNIYIATGHTFSNVEGYVIGGLGGNIEGGTLLGGCMPYGGGDVFIVGHPVLFNAGTIRSDGLDRICKGNITLDPPDILLAGDLVIEGASVSIFSPADWTIAISATIAGAPTILATDFITLSTGSGGTIDLTNIPMGTEIFHVVSGTVSIQSDVITTTVPVSTMVSGNTPITTAPSVDIYNVVIPSTSRVYQTVKAGEVFTLNFLVQNTGNITDTYEIRFASQDPNWSLIPDTMFTQTLGIFEDVNLPVAVTVPIDFGGGLNTVSCTISSPHASTSAATLISGCTTINPEVNFVYTPESPMVNTSVTFQAVASLDTRVAPPVGNLTYIWNFGDGRFGTGAQITHSFRHEGTFSVTLQMENDCDTRTVIHEVSISLYRIYLPVVLRNE